MNMKYQSSFHLLFLTLLICQLATAMSAKNHKFLNYNIYKGMSQDTTLRKEHFVKWMQQLSPDIVGMEEVNYFTQSTLDNMANKYGHPYSVLLKEQGYPVALTSRYPIVNVRRVTDNMHHGMIVAQILDYHIIVTHLSPHRWEKRGHEIDLIMATIKATAPKGKWIVMGDFNAYSPIDIQAYADGLLKDRTFKLEQKYKSHKNLRNNELDFTVIQKVLDAGFIDALKVKHSSFVSSVPTKVLEHKTLDVNPPFRIDYMFVSNFLKKKILSCDILKDSFTDNYSDHYPVLMELSDK